LLRQGERGSGVDSIVSGLAVAAIGKLGSIIWDRFTKVSKDYDQEPDQLKERLENHLEYAANWSKHNQVHGMGDPEEIDETTIELSMDTHARNFRGQGSGAPIRTETDVLTDQYHYLILGEPGAGKTTTLRRLTRTILLEPPIGPTDKTQYPIVLPLRDLNAGATLFEKVADRIGLDYRTVELKKREQTGVDQYGRPIYEEITYHETRIGRTIIDRAIPEILNRTRALLLLDGIDELSSGQRDSVLRSIRELAPQLRSARIVASSRTGDYNFNLPGFRVAELQPLDDEQIRTIAEKWLSDDPDDFLQQLERLTYFDVADRPLLLTHLLLIYKHDQTLPRKPSLVYNRLTRLLLEEWDRARGIRRTTQYSGFDADRKREFLGAMAYNLTYHHDKKVFTEDDLIQAYNQERDVFGLPANEARRVAREIQTHNGIIVEGADDTYEFSHLTLQEFLCAEHLVRLPGPPTIPPEHASYPAPLAVSVALSRAPGHAFARVVLGRKNLEQLGPAGVDSFLRRLGQESPDFERSEALGAAMLKLFTMAAGPPDWRTIKDPLKKILSFERVVESIADVMHQYIVTIPDDKKRHEHLGLATRRDACFKKHYEFRLPGTAALPASLLPAVMKTCRTLTGKSKTQAKITIDKATANRIAEQE